MVDKILIEKINNGYITSMDWFNVHSKETVYHKDLGYVCDYLETVFGQIEKRIRKETIPSAN